MLQEENTITKKAEKIITLARLAWIMSAQPDHEWEHLDVATQIDIEWRVADVFDRIEKEIGKGQ